MPDKLAASDSERRRTVGDVAHLGHVELLTPRLEESTSCFVQVLGLREIRRHDEAVYLRGESEYELYGLKLTAATRPGVGHVALRARSAAEISECARRSVRNPQPANTMSPTFSRSPCPSLTWRVYIGRYVRIPATSVRAYIQANTVEAINPQLPVPRPRRPGARARRRLRSAG